MTFDAFLNAITGSTVADWVRVAGRNPGELRFVLRSDVATTLELGGAPRLDAAAEAGWGPWVGKTQLRQLDCFWEGRLVYGDVVMLAATGNGLLPLPRNRAGRWGRRAEIWRGSSIAWSGTWATSTSYLRRRA